MPIQTDLSVSPYYDDYDASKDYYKILFRPGEAVQVRELNQLQTILQKQIERFGDNILKRGTIVDGCQIVHHKNIPYIKIKDTTISSTSVNVTDYVGLVARNSSNLVSYVVDGKSGFESQNPNLNTLYLKYLNSSDTQNTATYSAGDILSVFNNDRRLYGIKVDNGSTGFTNSDSVVVLSSLELQNTTGGTDFGTTFQVGETITQSTTGAQALVVASNTTANDVAVVLQIKPLATDLASQNTNAWDTFAVGYEILGANSATTANTVGIVGSSAEASIKTAAGGRIDIVTVTTGGTGYYVPPQVSVSSATASAGEIGALSLTAKNYIANVTVASTSNSVGTAYAVTVGDGIVYQKGFFVRASKQFLVIEKYSPTPDQVVVGFSTEEKIVNSNSDSTLLDNSAGTLNENAPGANRLKLTPTLVIKTKEEAETDFEFFPIIEFSEGNPFIQHRSTEYSTINDEMARRTADESGNYVLDPFRVTSRSVTTSFADEANSVSLVIDPGHAYIAGYRVQTDYNYITTVDKAKTTTTETNANIDVVYGNYVRVKELGGFHKFNVGDQVSLRDTASAYLSTTPGAVITAGAGTEIGKARVRSLVLESGEPGSPNAVYRLHIFDVKINVGKNFKDVRSFYYDDANNDGVADVVTEIEATSGNPIAVIREKDKNGLIFVGQAALMQSSSLSYVYRTTDDTLTSNTAGIITLSASVGEEWPYAGLLTSTEERDLIVVPLVDITASANSSGSVTITGSNAVGTSTSFVTELTTGDYIELNDGSNTAVTRVTSIANNTFITIEPAVSTIGAGANLSLAFPKNVPVPLHSRSNRTANVTGTSLFIDLGTAISATSNVAVTFNTRVTNATPVTKSTVRKNYVKIQANTSSSGITGPWPLGFSDIFRLRAVYAGETTSNTDITDEFYIDHNQNANYYDIGYLYKKPDSTYTLANNDILLVEFDLLTHSGEGIKTFGSYNIDDTKTLAQHDAGSTMSLLEIPEVFGADGSYYDLRDAFDFRPRTVNTVAQSATAGGAPVNPALPSEATRFSGTGKKFPVPEGDLTLDYTYYDARVDSVIVRQNGKFEVLTDEVREAKNLGEIVLSHVKIPPYPSLPETFSNDLIELTDTKIANEKYSGRRLETYQIDSVQLNTQPYRYTMDAIGGLERRIESLEYYARLTETEDRVKDKAIPSAVDASLERYKFGFFVDNFTSKTFSDTSVPEYKAEIFEYRLYPQKDDFAVRFKASDIANNDNIINGNKISFPYDKYRLVSQRNATDGSIDTGIPDTGTEPVIPNYSMRGVNIIPSIRTYKRSGDPADIPFEETIFTLTQNTGADGVTCTIYFDAFGGNDRIEVYQSDDPTSFGTIPLTTSENCVLLTQANRNYLTNEKVFRYSSYRKKNWSKLSRPDFNRSNNGGLINYWVRNAGKIEFSYNTADGRYLLIRDIKGSPYHSYRFEYPIDDLGTPNSDTYLNTTKVNRIPTFMYNSPDDIENSDDYEDLEKIRFLVI